MFEKSFIKAYVTEKISLDAINDYVGYWQTHKTEKELCDFLGMSQLEYQLWRKNGNEYIERNILSARKTLDNPPPYDGKVEYTVVADPFCSERGDLIECNYFASKMTYEKFSADDGDWDEKRLLRTLDWRMADDIVDLLNSGKLNENDINEYVNNHKNLGKEQILNRLFVDMDGTLAVFSPVNRLEALYEKGYFENLKPQRNVVEAVKDIIKRNPDIEVNILSAYLSDSPYAITEKNAWLDKYLPEIATKNRNFLPCGQDKKDYVENLRETDFLLDDYTENLNTWEPPARGIKLLTDINNTHGSWASDRIRYDKPPDEIAKDIVSVIHGDEHVLDESPETRESIDRRRNNLFQRLFAQGIEKDVVLNAYNQGEFSNGYLDDSKDFHLLGRDDVTSVAVFSDPENLLSHASINMLSGQDYTVTDRIAPAGNKFEALTRYLDDNPNINNIIICTNNNKTCQIEAEQLKNKLLKAGYVPENGYHCERQLPTGQKNFNDYLKELRQQGAERSEEYALEE